MSFFQNPFHEDFEGSWLLADRHHIPKFVVKRNAGRGAEYVTSWKDGPYDLSGNDSDGETSDTLKISFSLHGNKNWATISIDVTSEAASSASVTSAEIVASLNANALFAERFIAELSSYNTGAPLRVSIKQRKPSTEFKFYVINGQAEESIGFNARAGVAELPTYFSRHSLANRFTFEDSVGMLVELNVSNNVDEAVINNAVDHKGASLGFSSSSVSEDWQLLEGRSGLFQFTKGPSGSAVSSTATTIIYHAGAKAGDLAKKIVVQKDSGGVVVAEFEMPYTLESGDLISPP
jgi:hypothetical protein